MSYARYVRQKETAAAAERREEEDEAEEEQEEEQQEVEEEAEEQEVVEEAEEQEVVEEAEGWRLHLHSRNSTGYKGVSAVRGRFHAQASGTPVPCSSPTIPRPQLHSRALSITP